MFTKILKYVYKNLVPVQANKRHTNQFEYTQGIGQDDEISSMLFNIFVNDVEQVLAKWN